jgi:hypothetical protein
MNSPCPVQQLVDHSAEHFQIEEITAVTPMPIPMPETYRQLVGRRADNVEMLSRLVRRLFERPEAPGDAESLGLALSGLKMAEGSLRRIHKYTKEVS